VVVNGPEASVPALEQLLRTGPAYAQVDRVDRSSEPAAPATGKSFDII
jgi:hypothetical protein